RGYPLGTVAFYGPDDRRASKVAVGIVPKEGAEAAELERWFSDQGDVRDDPDLINAITTFLEGHAVKSVILADRILGCPHEEGVDHPLGENVRCARSGQIAIDGRATGFIDGV